MGSKKRPLRTRKKTNYIEENDEGYDEDAPFYEKSNIVNRGFALLKDRPLRTRRNTNYTEENDEGYAEEALCNEKSNLTKVVKQKTNENSGILKDRQRRTLIKLN